MLGEAEVLYDFPAVTSRISSRSPPRLRWVQGSMAGAGEVAQRASLGETDIVVTTRNAAAASARGHSPSSCSWRCSSTPKLDHLRRDKAENLAPGDCGDPREQDALRGRNGEYRSRHIGAGSALRHAHSRGQAHGTRGRPDMPTSCTRRRS